MVKGRLILVPQYPTKMRYQEWWLPMFQSALFPHFTEVIVLGDVKIMERADAGAFAPVKASLEFEMSQIQQYIDLDIRDSDTLLLNDISFPGLFTSVLLHKKPKKCYAICHATSLNLGDYFEAEALVKFPMESASSLLFDKIIVGSHYHKNKLEGFGWNNIVVLPLPLPLPPERSIKQTTKKNEVVSVARPSWQKINQTVENSVSKVYPIQYYQGGTGWDDYYQFLEESKILFISSREDTFGYSIYDAYMTNTYVVAPNKLSFPEILSSEHLYETTHDAVDIIKRVLDNGQYSFTPLTLQSSINFFNNLVDIML